MTWTRRQLIKVGGLSTVGFVGGVLIQSCNNRPNLAGSKSGESKLQSFEFEVVTLDPRGNIATRNRRQAKYFTEELGNGVTLDMVSIPGGTFLMGSPSSEAGRSNSESPQYSRRIEPFSMGKFTVTQAQWKAVAALPEVKDQLVSDPSYFKGNNLPVEEVSWHNAVEFCARLSNLTGREYRLPSEAEWEYACRAGKTTPFHFGETISAEVANYDGRYAYGRFPGGKKGVYRQKTTPVGSFGVANNFGLYDMHGNVSEWCADVWRRNYEGAPNDGRAWLDKNDNGFFWMPKTIRARVLRGGSWNNNPDRCRSAYRGSYDPHFDYISNDVGFRVVCAVV